MPDHKCILIQWKSMFKSNQIKSKFYRLKSIDFSSLTSFSWPITFPSKSPHLLGVYVIQMVLNKLDSGSKVSLVELVGDVPSNGSELPPLLDSGMEEGHSVQHGLPLRKVGILQLFLKGSHDNKPLITFFFFKYAR